MKPLLPTCLFLFFFPTLAFAASIVVVPEHPMQGEPMMVVIEGVKSLTFTGKKVGLFLYQSKPTVLIPIDLAQKVGEYPLTMNLRDGTKFQKTITVTLRPKISAPLGIPDKLGGNTKVAQDNFVQTLSK